MTAVPDVLRPRRPRRPLAIVGRALAPIAIVAVLSPALVADDSSRNPDPTLVESVRAIREAFRTRHTDPILALLPATGKIFLAVKPIAPDPSYYSRDQVEVLLRRAFAALETLQFHINIDHPGDSSSTSSLIVCPSLWTYVDRGSKAELRLRFLLSRQDEKWQLTEIRETR
jgi:hypothetical protein